MLRTIAYTSAIVFNYLAHHAFGYIHAACTFPLYNILYARDIASSHSAHAHTQTKKQSSSVYCWSAQVFAIPHYCYSALPRLVSILAPERPYISLFPNSIPEMELWKRFMADPEITADCLPPDNTPASMATTKSSKSSVILTAAEQHETVGRIFGHPQARANGCRSPTSWSIH